MPTDGGPVFDALVAASHADYKAGRRHLDANAPDRLPTYVNVLGVDPLPNRFQRIRRIYTTPAAREHTDFAATVGELTVAQSFVDGAQRIDLEELL